ncbi:twin-arginine translocase subunit TatC [Haloferacaceae archaeon DSL9]
MPTWWLLRTVRARLRVLFVAFVCNFLGAFYLVRSLLWPRLEADLLVRGAEIVALTPFDVVLLQAKLATIAGVVFTLPLVVVAVQASLVRGGTRTWLRSRWRTVVGVGGLAVALFAGGSLYAYRVLFPFLFAFLSANAIASGFTPTYSIVHWTQFVLTLAIVMGAAAELPLVMTALVAAEIVSYDALRTHWRVAVFGIVIVSSIVNGSPDPVSMILVAGPLIALYGAGLLCAKLVAAVRIRESASVTTAPNTVKTSDTNGVTAGTPDTAVAAADCGSARIADAFDATAVGVLDAFSEARSTDGISGHYDEIRYVAVRLREKLLALGSAFALVFAVVFTALYQGGMRLLVDDFVGRVAPTARPSDVNLVLIHPVELLAFEMKIAAILAAVAVAPLCCFYIWSALRERGLAAGAHGAFAWWAAALVVGLLFGSLGGYLFVAPTMTAYVVADAVGAGMIISYRAPSFFWLIFLASVGMGLLADIVVTMVSFHVSGIVSYRTMRRYWREVAVSFCCLGALLPQGIAVMLVIAIPVMVAYGIGLAVLWLLTLGGRLAPVRAT